MEFFVVPDCPEGCELAGLLPYGADTRVLRHASGSPWLVGSWTDTEITEVTAGERRLVLLGATHTDTEWLRRRMDGAAEVSALDAPARELAGSHYLCASWGGEIRAHGSLSGVRRLFHARFRGVTVATNQPQRLAQVLGLGVDERALATQLLVQPPWPLNDPSLWRGVVRLAPGHALRINRRGTARETRWWTPPEPSVPVREGASVVRTALAEAVTARTSAHGKVSSDLSGGMDSTSLAYLAAPHVPHLTTTRFTARDAANEDGFWADRAAADLGGTHCALTVTEAAMNFAGLLEPGPATDNPFPAIRARGMLRAQAAALASRGSRHHLTGHGGDELFHPAEPLDRTLVLTHPLGALRRLRSHRALRRPDTGRLLRELADRSSYPQALSAAAQHLGTSPERAPANRWGIKLQLPPWATGLATGHARHVVREAAHDARPLSPYPAQHAVLDVLQISGRLVRHGDQFTSALGVSWHAPMLDDRVVEAALSVRSEDHTGSGTYKPVLAAAMRGTVPDELLDRPNKGEFSADIYAGLRRFKGELAQLTEGMRLADAGLVDPRAFRAALLGTHPMPRDIIRLLSTLSCELWLRSVEETATGTARPARPARTARLEGTS